MQRCETTKKKLDKLVHAQERNKQLKYFVLCSENKKCNLSCVPKNQMKYSVVLCIAFVLCRYAFSAF